MAIVKLDDPKNPKELLSERHWMAREGRLTCGVLQKSMPRDKLEVKQKDHGWFLIRTMFRIGDNVVVRFPAPYNSEPDDVRSISELQKNPINTFVRIASPQVQDKDCNTIILGEHVCVLYEEVQEGDGEVKTGKNGWFDALITRRSYDKHTKFRKQEKCPCKFTVEWVEGPLKGRRTKNLGCKSLCNLATKDVETHPIVFNIFHGKNEGIVQEEVDEEDTTKVYVRKPKKPGLEADMTKVKLEGGA